MKRFILKIRQFYGNLKLQYKMTFLLILSGCVPLLIIGLVFYNDLYNMVVSNTIRQEQDMSAKTSPLIEQTVQEILNIDEELRSLKLYNILFKENVEQSWSSIVESSDASDFQKQTQTLVDNSLATGIQIYVDLPAENEILFSHENTKNVFAPVSTIRGTYWYGIFQGSGVSELHCPSFYLGSLEQQRNGDTAYIHRSYIRYGDTSIPCYIAVYYSSDILIEILSENLQLDGSVSYIMNDRDALVASTDESLSGIYWIDYETIRESFMSSNNFIERTILDNKVYAGFYSINQSGWFMVTILPSQPIVALGNTIMVRYVVLYLVFLASAILLAALLAKSITTRISSVISQMRLVRQGPPVSMEPPRFRDEVGDLINTYNYMTQKMNQLIAEQGKAAEDLRIAEFNSLQAQINPHFLYNTMDMINWLAQQGRTDEVSNAVQDLSRFYKLTLSRKQSISTIDAEEEHVSIYLRLQNMRFHDNIEFISDIPDELSEYQIPKLTLQPVIENAVLHGILEKDTKAGTIVLTGWLEDNDIVLMISDDGVGIPEEKLATILSGTGKSSSGGTNIAVYNTHRRLQILYGNEYGLSYSSSPGEGTEVQIRIPAQKEYENPYIHVGRSALSDRSFVPLNTFSSIDGVTSNSMISAETMLSYSQKLTQGLYKLHNLHQVFKNLPEEECLFLLSHEVTKDFPNHTHEYFELNYVCSGSVINIVDGNELYMTAGDLVFLNQKAIHSLRYQQPDTLLINFCLKPEIFQNTLNSFYKEKNPISDFLREEASAKTNYMFFALKQDLQVQSLITSIIQEYAKNNFHHSYSLDAYFLLLFTYLVNTEEFSHYGIDHKTHKMIETLQELCLNEPISYIAGRFNLTTEQLNMHLKAKTGRDCQSFVDEVRLNKAAQLLADPNLNIYQIAENCGFSNAEDFFKMFQQKFQISPIDYRKQFL